MAVIKLLVNVLLIFFLGAGVSSARMYKCTSADGETTYQKQTCKDISEQKALGGSSGKNASQDAGPELTVLDQYVKQLEHDDTYSALRDLQAAKLGISRSQLDRSQGIAIDTMNMAAKSGRVLIGMSKKYVIRAWGKPDRILSKGRETWEWAVNTGKAVTLLTENGPKSANLISTKGVEYQGEKVVSIY